MVVHGKLYCNDGYREGGGQRRREGNNPYGGVYARGNQVNYCYDFGLVGSKVLILVLGIPRHSRVQSRIDPKKHESWLQMQKRGPRRRTLRGQRVALVSDLEYMLGERSTDRLGPGDNRGA